LGTNGSQRFPLIPDKPEQLPSLIILLPIHNLLGDGALHTSFVSLLLRAPRFVFIFLNIDIATVKKLSNVLAIHGLQRQFSVGGKVLTLRVEGRAQCLDK
jgi:hypothetical protein